MAETAQAQSTLTPAAPPPSVLERWLGFAPMLTFFVVLALSTPFNYELWDKIDLFGVELPLPTKLAMGVAVAMTDYFWLWMPVMLAVSWSYFAWCSKIRLRILTFSIVASVLLILSMAVLASPASVYRAIHTALSRR